MIESPPEVGFHVFFLLSEFGTSWTHFLNGIVLPLPNCKTLPSCKKALVRGGRHCKNSRRPQSLTLWRNGKILDCISIVILLAGEIAAEWRE